MRFDKSKYICVVPFKYTEVFDNKQFLCCPSWLGEDISDGKSITTSFFSQKSNEIRKSIIDGEYTFCDHNQCPHLNSLINNGVLTGNCFIEKEKVNVNSLLQNAHIKTLNMCFDRSCNLQCPTCRSELINYIGIDRQNVETKLSEITEEIGSKINRLYLSGTADPFYSKSYRQFLINFDKTKFPALRSIHLHTNALLWTKQLWGKMTGVHKYIRSCEISVDAATKDTYENKVRINGNWETLLDNIEFIKTIKTLHEIRVSFVVQKNNYTEVALFYDLFSKILNGTNKKYTIFYNRIANWGTYSDEEFLDADICNINHPNYQEFYKLFKPLLNKPHIEQNISTENNFEISLI